MKARKLRGTLMKLECLGYIYACRSHCEKHCYDKDGNIKQDHNFICRYEGSVDERTYNPYEGEKDA